MKCDFCDKKATVFLTQLVEGQMKKVCLCDQCAKERGVTDPTGFSLADLLLGGVAAGGPPRRSGKRRSAFRWRSQMPDLRVHARRPPAGPPFWLQRLLFHLRRGGRPHGPRHAQGHLAHRQGACWSHGPQVLHQRLEELRARSIRPSPPKATRRPPASATKSATSAKSKYENHWNVSFSASQYPSFYLS
jgi:hypothetical protein